MLPEFLQFLVNEQSITQAQAKELLSLQRSTKKTLDELIVREMSIDEDALLEKKSAFYHLPSVNLKKVEAPKEEVVAFVADELIKTYEIVPFELKGKRISIAMVHPQNVGAREAVEFIARQKNIAVTFYVCTASGLDTLLKRVWSITEEVEEALVYADQEKQKKETKEELPSTEAGLEEVIKSAPVSKMVNVILRHAVEGGASDIHIEPDAKESRVRYRIDGKLNITLTLPKYIHPSIVSRVKVLANLKIDETRKPQDGRIHVSIEGREIDLRVSTLPLQNAEKVVMRILDVTRGAPTLGELGFIGRNLKVVEENISQPNGMFLVTGPTGSGKSTTLFSALSMVNSEDVNIVTLEDPVEYTLRGANQSQVHPEVGFTFATGLRSILRQDPDIIMVGEIRDNETAELAVQAALTGHLVFSTLHTNDALGAIPRLLDMKVESFLLASTINMVLAQRLVRKLCPQCKQPAPLSGELQKTVEKTLLEIPEDVLYEGIDKSTLTGYKAVGCDKCGLTGYIGRLAILEAVVNTRPLEVIIAKGFSAKDARDELRNQGFVSMMQDGIMKALLGLTTVEEVVVASKE